MPDEGTPEGTPTDPSAAAFDRWASGAEQTTAPLQPAAAPQAQAVAAPAAAVDPFANIEPETRAVFDQYDARLRGDLREELEVRDARTNESIARSTLWAQFQEEYPQFAGQDGFIGESFDAVAGGRIPKAELRGELFTRIAAHARGRLDAMQEPGEVTEEITETIEEPNRTAGVSAGSVPGKAVSKAKDKTSAPEEHQDPDSSLLSDLVEEQGKLGDGEFFEPISHEDAVRDYGKSALATNANKEPTALGG